MGTAVRSYAFPNMMVVNVGRHDKNGGLGISKRSGLEKKVKDEYRRDSVVRVNCAHQVGREGLV